MRLAARDTLINDLGSVRAGGDLRLDAARIENRATLTGHVRHAGENTVGGGGYGFWRGLAYLDYRLRYGNGAAVAAPFYDVALQAGQSRIESGGDLYVNRELGPGRRGICATKARSRPSGMPTSTAMWRTVPCRGKCPWRIICARRWRPRSN